MSGCVLVMRVGGARGWAFLVNGGGPLYTSRRSCLHAMLRIWIVVVLVCSLLGVLWFVWGPSALPAVARVAWHSRVVALI